MRWVAELYDRLSGPARRMSQSIGTLNARLDGTGLGLRRLDQRTALAGRSMHAGRAGALSFGAALGVLGMATAAAASAVGLLSLGYKIGEAGFKAFAFKESALVTGKALWGTVEAAEAMFNQATDLARLTPFNVGEVVTAFNRLGAAGFGAEEVPVVFQGLADIASMSGRGKEAIGSLTLAFSQIIGKGKLAGQELNQITEAAGGAVSRLKLFGKISELMGRKVTEVDMEAGLIPARTALMAIMQIGKDLGGGVLGSTTIAQSKTLAGLWSNLEDTITNVWLTMDLSKAPWFTKTKAFLSGIIDALDVTSRSGRHLQMVLERLFGRVLGSLNADDIAGSVVRLMNAFETFATHAIVAFQGLWDGLKVGFGPLLDGMGALSESEDAMQNTRDVFEAIGIAVGTLVLGLGSLGAMANAIVTPLRFLGDVLQRIVDFVHNIGVGTLQVITGSLVTGLTGGLVDMRSTAEEGANNFLYGFKRILGIASPSKVFEGLGENVVEGFGRGMARTPGMDGTSAEELVTTASRARSAAGGGGGTSVALTVNVNAAGGDADAIAQKLREILPSTIAGLFDQLATERGVA